ncbi:hypothetical protein U1Q18_020693 [Sarracenia purpurea var. burkii]
MGNLHFSPKVAGGGAGTGVGEGNWLAKAMLVRWLVDKGNTGLVVGEGCSGVAGGEGGAVAGSGCSLAEATLMIPLV